MDNDIDIEEHDVLDNPRIKSMFPDLALVKIEVPDDEDMEEFSHDTTEYNSEVTVDDDPHMKLFYQYDYNTVTETDDTEASKYNNTLENGDETGHHEEYTIIDSGQSINGDTGDIDSPQLSTEVDMYVDTEYSQVDSKAQYIPNKIIVGSKPNKKVVYNYDTLYEEALNSQAVVHLEDWGMKLNASSCYCGTCETLFSTINALDAHKMVSHSYLVAVSNNTARKSTTACNVPPMRSLAKKSTTYDAGRLCNHCNNIFPDDTTLIKHLYELLPLNNFTTDNQVSLPKNNSKVSVKVPITDSVLPNKKVANVNVNKKVVPIKMKSDVAIKNVKINSKSVAIPKPSVVSTKIKKHIVKSADVKKIDNLDTIKAYYKCSLCHDIVENKKTAQRHRKIKHPTYSKVHIFERVYTSGKYENEVMSIRASGRIDSSIIAKSILWQCGKCRVHLVSPYSAMQHFIACTKVYPSEECSICHKHILQKDKVKHYIQHEHSNDTFKVYIVKNKTIYERVLCECPYCGVYLEELPFWVHVKSCMGHLDFTHCKICDKNIAKNRYRCHEIKHRFRNFGKKDFITVKYFHNKAFGGRVMVEPPKNIIPIEDTTFKSTKKIIFYCPYCKCCQNRQRLTGHIDRLCIKWPKWHKRLCDKCGLMFNLKTYSIHQKLHQNDKFVLSEHAFIDLITRAKIDPPISTMYECETCKVNFICNEQLTSHDCGEEKFKFCNICNKKYSNKSYSIHKEFHGGVEMMPELLLKYNSLCSTWNLMFKCINCDMVCLSYDTAVEHSQKHILFAADTSIYCTICKLTVHETNYQAHADLHETNSSVTIDSFKILNYDYKRLFNNDWMDYGDLNEQDINVILSKSIYKTVRSVKMNATGDSDSVKYCCCVCKMSIDDVAAHLSVNCKNNNKIRCRYCKIKIDDLNDLVAHEVRHENTSNDHKIVTFNNEKDRKVNAKLKKYSSKAEKLSRKTDNKNAERDKRFKAYCCRKCDVCITLKQNMRAHRCLTDNTKKHYCKRCNQYFALKFKNNHDIAHIKFPTLSKKTLSITYFNESYKKSQTTDLMGITSKIFKVVKLKGETDTKLKIKLKKHTSKLENRVENDKRYRLYCCKACKVCVTLKQNMNMHRCTVIKYYCKECNQYFSFNFRANHEQAHRNFPNLCKETLSITYFGEPNTPELADIDNNKHILYKCDCNIHYDTIESIKKHANICNSTSVIKEKCLECGLVFPAEEISQHKHGKEIVIKSVIKTNWYQCAKCEILFVTENEVRQHSDDCDPKYGVRCDKCEHKYLKNCINSHRCCQNETTLYILTVTKIKQDLNQITVYGCAKCNVHYWSLKSYEWHVTRDHSVRRIKENCKICKLYYTKKSYETHYGVHNNAREYKIKIINPVTNQYKVIRGRNAVTSISESGIDSVNITRSRKRQMDADIIDKVNFKKSKESDASLNADNGTVERDANETLKRREGEGDSDPNSTLSNRKQVQCSLSVRFDNTLYKCPKCPLHYLHFESLRSHIKCHSVRKSFKQFECDICHLKFSTMLLPRHISLQHEENKFNLNDFDIREVEMKNGFYVQSNEKPIENIDHFNDFNSQVGSRNELDVTDDFDKSNTENKVVDGSTVSGDLNYSNTEFETSINSESPVCNSGINEKESACNIDKNLAIDNKNREIELFKCNNCNVCFITKEECLQHVQKHVTIDSKYYISCKICNFQFMIGSLKLHMEKHHDEEFNLENVIIGEYTILDDNSETKFESYCAVDRVQSRLISTTTDEGKDDM